MAIKALMVDVDGVLIVGRPEDGGRWHAAIEDDFGFARSTLQEQFFLPYWDDILVGRTGLMEQLAAAMQTFASNVSPERFVSYWFERDSGIARPMLAEISAIRAGGIHVYLATNQEHLRAAYIMKELGLAEHVDGIFYSAQLGAKKPDADFFSKAQAAVGLTGNEILLIDDSRENIEAAKTVGWQTLHWTRDSSPDIVQNLCASL